MVGVNKRGERFRQEGVEERGGQRCVKLIPIKEGEVKIYKGIKVRREKQEKANIVYTVTHAWEMKEQEDKVFILLSKLEEPRVIIKGMQRG